MNILSCFSITCSKNEKMKAKECERTTGKWEQTCHVYSVFLFTDTAFSDGTHLQTLCNLLESILAPQPSPPKKKQKKKQQLPSKKKKKEKKKSVRRRNPYCHHILCHKHPDKQSAQSCKQENTQFFADQSLLLSALFCLISLFSFLWCLIQYLSLLTVLREVWQTDWKHNHWWMDTHYMQTQIFIIPRHPPKKINCGLMQSHQQASSIFHTVIIPCTMLLPCQRSECCQVFSWFTTVVQWK